MSIFSWIILGLIAGFIASKIVNKQGEGFFLATSCLELSERWSAAGFLSSLATRGVTGLNLYSMHVAIIGAVVVLVVYHTVRRVV